MKVKDIVNVIEDYADPLLAADWDNVGLQIGSLEDEVNGIVLAMDMDQNTLDYAVINRANLIITHHPLIFPSFSNLTDDNYRSELIMDMIRYEMNLIVAHTNLDAAQEGVNEVLLKKLALNQESFVEWEEEAPFYMRIGEWHEPLSFDGTIQKIKNLMKYGSVKVGGEKFDVYHRVAVASGSGASEITFAAEKGCQGIITGDVKYHDFQLAREKGITVFDMGHYDSERHVLTALENMLNLKSTIPTFVLDKIGFYYEEF